MGSFQNYKRIGSRYHALLMVKILWCSQSGDLPENNLAKFGYVIDMKKKNRILLCSWLPTRTHHKNLAIFGIIFLQNLTNLELFFSPWKILCIDWRKHSFQVQIWRKFVSERNTVQTYHKSIFFSLLTQAHFTWIQAFHIMHRHAM